jgi:hypothetical protein
MKKSITILFMFFITIGFTQIKLEKNNFQTIIWSGNKVDKNINLLISEETKEKIFKSEDYINFLKNVQLIELNKTKRNIQSEFEVYLFLRCHSAARDIQMINKVPSSVDYLESDNVIFFIDDKIAVSLAFKYDDKSYKGVSSIHGARIF